MLQKVKETTASINYPIIVKKPIQYKISVHEKPSITCQNLICINN